MEIQTLFGFLKIKFDHFTKGNEEKGQALKAAGHVFGLIERGGVISATVMRQTSVNLPPYNVQITLDKERNVCNASCSCIAGISGHCKHISATVLCVNEEDSSTQTSRPCTWKEPYVAKTAKAKYMKGQRFTEIFGAPKRQNIYPPVEVTAGMVTFSTPSMLQYMLGPSSTKCSTSITQTPTRLYKYCLNEPKSRPSNFEHIIYYSLF
ncbi:uncharacterized protein LOC123312774 isoform X1 [Coccinella septempunctata]|uniref:uncharacterized protein LOC123312774 isoform X1 n=1 Tax=Coccinella septempunctata TaxID=41139 RepID=UPI001D06315C|nr:uncharacterized protein LOC123312774 isoform X1 [Coccinella septempunctata]